jgi:hypothetical protein
VEVSRLKIFHGTLEDAQEAARQDYNQSKVECITGWTGDPFDRKTLDFRVKFADGEVWWLPYQKDLFDTEVFGRYVESKPPLRHLAYTKPSVGLDFVKRKQKQPIKGYILGEKLFVPLRSYGPTWYDTLDCLLDRHDVEYMVEYSVIDIHPMYLSCRCELFNETWDKSKGIDCLDSYWAYAWGSIREWDDQQMKLVTVDLLREFPQIIPYDQSRQLEILRYHTPGYTISTRKTEKEG